MSAAPTLQALNTLAGEAAKLERQAAEANAIRGILENLRTNGRSLVEYLADTRRWGRDAEAHALIAEIVDQYGPELLAILEARQHARHLDLLAQANVKRASLWAFVTPEPEAS